MASLNKSFVMGTLGQDPQLKYTTGGTAVCEISLACNRNWKDKSSGERKEAVDWIPVVLWGRTAEIAGEYLRRGSSCLIEGRLEISSWEKDGQKHSRMKVVAEHLTLLGSKRDSSDQTPSSYSGSESQAEPTGSRDSFSGEHSTPESQDVPF